MPDPVVISMAQCHEKYKELNLGNHSYRKKLKPSDESFHNVEQILESFSVKVTKITEDEAREIEWNLEWKRIQAAYLRMIKVIQSRKNIGGGTFFDSRNYFVFAKVNNEENEAEDPTLEVMFGFHKYQGRLNLLLGRILV